MTQPNKPGPSWEKEAEEAAEDKVSDAGLSDGVDELGNPSEEQIAYQWFLKGARWAKEKAAAPGEESWEKIRDEYCNLSSGEKWSLSKSYDEARRFGFDKALELVAKPLLAKLDIKHRELCSLRMTDPELLESAAKSSQFAEEMRSRAVTLEKERDEARAEVERLTIAYQSLQSGFDIEALEAQVSSLKATVAAVNKDLCFTKQCLEAAGMNVTSLKATEAALREENERLQKACAERCESQQKLADDVRTVAKERDTLRQQLADAKDGLDNVLLAGFGAGAEKEPLLQQALVFARDALAKLKAPSDKDAGEGSDA